MQKINKFQLLDSHSHSPDSKSEKRVQNVFAHELSEHKFSNDQLYSTGVHPWHSDKVDESDYVNMRTYIYRYPNIVAIGETGIDRRCSINLQDQFNAFEIQIKMAIEFNKPLIIHCVKASSDILMFIKKYRFKFMMHGLNENIKITNDFIEKGAFISIGKSILNPTSKLRSGISSLPLERILLESDEESNVLPMYNLLSNLLELNLTSFSEVITSNFINFYGL